MPGSRLLREFSHVDPWSRRRPVQGRRPAGVANLVQTPAPLPNEVKDTPGGLASFCHFQEG